MLQQRQHAMLEHVTHATLARQLAFSCRERDFGVDVIRLAQALAKVLILGAQNFQITAKLCHEFFPPCVLLAVRLEVDAVAVFKVALRLPHEAFNRAIQRSRVTFAAAPLV